MIHVCSLARLPEMVKRTGAHHVVSLLAKEDNLTRPAAITAENHLWLQVHDITDPVEGYVMPQQGHVEELIAFVQRWPREKPLIIHCYAGISRSTAAAFVTVCALNPGSDERNVAKALRLASPTATPNIRIVTIADQLLGRQGRMIKAIKAIGTGLVMSEALPFRIATAGH
jgi:predicted protein tyrosine phosphatase